MISDDSTASSDLPMLSFKPNLANLKQFEAVEELSSDVYSSDEYQEEMIALPLTDPPAVGNGTRKKDHLFFDLFSVYTS
jgi:hypothetical protein